MDKREISNGDIRNSDFMSNEEYRAELQKLFEDIESNRLLRYLYVLVSKIIGKLN